MIETVLSTLEKYYHAISVHVSNFVTLYADNILSKSSPFDNTSSPYIPKSYHPQTKVGHEGHPRIGEETIKSS